jgi:uncharacterized protein (DUF58 family)
MTLTNPIRWFLDSRIAAPDPRGRVRLTYRRVFILPTARGWGFALLLLLMLVSAINYNNSLGYALTFLLAGLGQVAMYHTYRNLIGLELRAGATREACAGDRAGFELLLHNPDARDRPALQAALAGAAPQTVGVPAGQTRSLWLQRPAPQRGRLQPGILSLETRFPLGLFRAWSRLELEQPAWIYPRPAAAPPPPQAPRQPSEAGDQGRGSDDFRGLRPFHSGDSLRHVHWKAVARGQGMLTKEFGGDRVEECWLDWDALDGLDTETRLSVLCRWVLDAAREQRHFGLRLPERSLGPSQGPAHRDRCLRALAAHGLAP